MCLLKGVAVVVESREGMKLLALLVLQQITGGLYCVLGHGSRRVQGNFFVKESAWASQPHQFA
jgi:hypothetical protein